MLLFLHMFSILGNFSLAQTPVICKYLGKKFGLYPETEEDIWHAEQVNATIHDYIAEGTIRNIRII